MREGLFRLDVGPAKRVKASSSQSRDVIKRLGTEKRKPDFQERDIVFIQKEKKAF